MIVGLSFVLAFLLRNGMEMRAANADALVYGTPLLVLIAGVAFYVFGAHRAVWSSASVASLTAIVWTATRAMLHLLLVPLLIDRAGRLSRTVPVIR